MAEKQAAGGLEGGAEAVCTASEFGREETVQWYGRKLTTARELISSTARSHSSSHLSGLGD